MDIKDIDYSSCKSLDQLKDYVLGHAEPEETLSVVLNKLLRVHHVSRSEVIRRAQINETFGYQIFVGSRNPTRNKIIALAFGLGASLKETQEILYAGGVSMLSRSNKRDLIVGYGLYSKYSISQMNETLFAHSLELIS